MLADLDNALNPEQGMILDLTRDFAQRNVRPRAAEIDRTDEFPHDLYQQLADLGLLGMTLPPEYGGAGLDNVTYVMALEEISVSSGTLANAMLLTKIQSDFIFRFGNEDQRRRYLPDLVAGRKICLIAATEPTAGSDVAAIKTTAQPEDGGYVISGEKAFMTAGAVGDLAVVLAKTAPALKHKGISAFIVERERPGYAIGHKDELLGMRGLATADLIFDHCWVPAENLIGQENEGFKNAMQSFETGRIVIATLALGLARCALEEAAHYAGQRQAFGHRIGDFQAIQFMLADMATEIDAARLLIHRAARLKDAGKPFGKEAAMAKLFASDAAQRAATNALQIHGGFGYTKDATVERIYRDARLTQIYEGTNQIQRLIIARKVQQELAGGRA